MRKPTIWVPTRPDTNWPVQSHKQARSLKFRIEEEEGCVLSVQQKQRR